MPDTGNFQLDAINDLYNMGFINKIPVTDVSDGLAILAKFTLANPTWYLRTYEVKKQAYIDWLVDNGYFEKPPSLVVTVTKNFTDIPMQTMLTILLIGGIFVVIAQMRKK